MGVRVLIVDDALFMRNMLKAIFTEAGYEVAGEAGDGAEAVAMYRDLKPDLVTMDIVMPGKSGIEALQEIIAEAPGACVIMCSSLDRESLIIEAVEAGARDFIVKPFEERRVLEVASRLTGGSQE